MKKNILIAPEGKIYTNGQHYGKKVRLASWDRIENYYLISTEEYEQLTAEEGEI